MDLESEFIDREHPPKKYKVILGHRIATPLSGFIAGVILASIAWAVAFILHLLYFSN